MNDFEVHERGTATEIRLSRELIKEMEEIMEYTAAAIFVALVFFLLIYFGIEIYDHCKANGCGR